MFREEIFWGPGVPSKLCAYAVCPEGLKEFNSRGAKDGGVEAGN